MLRSLLSDADGNISTMRIFVLVFGLAVLGAWLFTVFKRGWVSPPWETAATLGGAKAAQAGVERWRPRGRKPDASQCGGGVVDDHNVTTEEAKPWEVW